MAYKTEAEKLQQAQKDIVELRAEVMRLRGAIKKLETSSSGSSPELPPEQTEEKPEEVESEFKPNPRVAGKSKSKKDEPAVAPKEF